MSGVMSSGPNVPPSGLGNSATQWHDESRQHQHLPQFVQDRPFTTGVLPYPQPAQDRQTGLTGDAASGESFGGHQQWPATTVSPYPDVSFYQQPHFYQQTDPAIYTSAWPPGNVSSYNDREEPTIVDQASPTFQGDSGHAVYGSAPSRFVGMGSASQDYYHSSVPVQHGGYHNTQLAPPLMTNEADAGMRQKVQSLYILDSLATQLINKLSKTPHPQILSLTSNLDTDECQAYSTLKSLFDQTRKVFTHSSSFIDHFAVQLYLPSHQDIIRKANVATFFSSVLGAHDVSFSHLDSHFLSTFVPQGQRLLKWQGALYLELKTQCYIAALTNTETGPIVMLEDYFPVDLDGRLQTRHPDAPCLSPGEVDFVERCRARKSYLLAEPLTDEGIMELPKKYQWIEFVRDVAGAISRNGEALVNASLRMSGTPYSDGPGLERQVPAGQSIHGESGQGQQQLGSVLDAPWHHATNEHFPAASSAMNTPAHAAVSKPATAHPSPAARQPWTPAEEAALLSGLTQVSGPHWSQILSFYGRGGSVSEVLKDRNQVQLKDKARNLKLCYLKMGREVPEALVGVTGELGKRGGARMRAKGNGENSSVDPELKGGGKGRAPRKKSASQS